MKKIFSKIVCFTLIFSMILGTNALAAFEDMTDVSGHWGEEMLEKAYNDGILTGYEDSTMRPNAKITTAQMITILCRVLNAQKSADISVLGLTPDIWYADAAGKALYMGLISPETGDLNATMNRGDAFYMMAKAFQIIKADPDMAKLAQYSDASGLKGEKRRAIASLVEDGFVLGDGVNLDIASDISRAEFIAVLYRVAGSLLEAQKATSVREGSAVISGNCTLSNVTLEDILFTSQVSNLNLRNVKADTVVLKTDSIKNFVLYSGTSINRLVFANDEGDIAFRPGSAIKINTVVVGDGKGKTDIGYAAPNLEITGSSRDVKISSNIQRAVISGSSNIIEVDRPVKELVIYGSNNTVKLDSNVEKLVVMGSGAKVYGNGIIKGAEVLVRDYEITATVKEYIDAGIASAEIALNAPDKLGAGKKMQLSAKVTNAPVDKNCKAVWIVDGKEISSQDVTLKEINEFTASHQYEYSKDMAVESTVRFELRYTTTSSEEQIVSAEKVVQLENFADEYYAIDNILDRVKTGYKGNYTLSWAQNHDYTEYEKERWVNEKGYSSSSKYLVWVNLTYQRVNIFEGSQGGWDLIRSGIVGTGAPSSPTPVGVWKTTYKQVAWVTPDYIVKPVVRFMGGGYAFHSRLYSPRNPNKIGDPSIGYPVSHGCVRMYEDDIQWMYDNIPSGTTVVVF